ncbi:MAG: hypothetical protein CMM45_07020 [Rhodospirillaceae bacterium]|nr:hypothetical protein [Rhodospirillaceae bacterium]
MTVADIPQLIERARARLDVEDFEAARSDYEAVLARDKDMTEALIGQGDSCFGLGEYDMSEHAYRAALKAAPSDPDALFGLAAVLRVTEYYEEAVSLYERGFDAEPERTEAYWELAYSREMSGDKEGAEIAYRSCLAQHPDHGMASHLLAAMTGATTIRAPKNYVRDLFDDYAETFDKDLVSDLNYVVPQLIENAVSAYLATCPRSTAPPFARVLDLGCGTGLVAEAIRPLTAHITGVDLSSKMLEIAMSENRIEESIVSDMIDFLQPSNNDDKFDLIVCGDALVYLGALEDVFNGVSHQLVDGGIFCFTVEDLIEGDFALKPTGRYAHNKEYVTNLLIGSQQTVLHKSTIVPRHDSNREIRGRLFMSQKHLPD